MKKWFADAPAGNGEGETHEIRAVKRAENLPSRLRSDNKQGNRNNVNVRGLPDFPFDMHTGFEFLDAVAGANDYTIASFLGGFPKVGRLSSLSRFHDLDPNED